MPLLNIVGITAAYCSFNAAFVFLCDEGEESYVWALREFQKIVTPKVLVSDRELALLKAISVVFPETRNILCIWHIEKNILSNCRKSFSQEEEWCSFMDQWSAIVYSQTFEEYNQRFENFRHLYCPIFIHNGL